MRALAVAVVLSVTLAAPAFADQAPAPGAATEPAKPAAKDDKADGVVCTRRIPTGSNLPVKVCTTAEQRKQHRKTVQSAQEQIQGNSAGVLPH